MKRLIVASLLSVITLSMTGCASRRAEGSIWENSKTAGRHMGRGFRALIGKHGDSRMIQHPNQFRGPHDEDYIAMKDDESDDLEFSKDKPYPLSMVSPGEKGSFLPSIEGFSEPNLQQATIFQPIYYDTNRDILRNEAGRKIVKDIAKYLKEHPNCYVFVEGHCDERGAALYNMSLGSRRSNTVRNLLIQEGVDLNRIFSISYGYEKPVNLGHNADSWNWNRRAQFKLFEVES